MWHEGKSEVFHAHARHTAAKGLAALPPKSCERMNFALHCGRKNLFGRGWKPHLRKWRGSSSTSGAGLPEVRHLAAPERGHGRGRHECWSGPQRWGALRFSAVSRKFSTHKVARKRDPPDALPTGRDALLRVRGGHGRGRQAAPQTRHLSLVTRHWRARRARRRAWRARRRARRILSLFTIHLSLARPQGAPPYGAGAFRPMWRSGSL